MLVYANKIIFDTDDISIILPCDVVGHEDSWKVILKGEYKGLNIIIDKVGFNNICTALTKISN